MSLRSVLVSLIVAGVLAGLVLLSRGRADSQLADPASSVRTIGIDPVSIVEVRAHRRDAPVQRAQRTSGTVDTWTLHLSDDEGDIWDANSTRVRTVLRALGTATITPAEDESIDDLAGTLSLVGRDGMTTELRFGNDATGGFVGVEIVSRGKDGIATSRWFGRIERSLRDSLLGNSPDQGLVSWRSMDLFGMTIAEIIGAEVASGADSTTLTRGSGGWRVSAPWDADADTAMVQGMLGLTLGLKAARFYDSSAYSDDLTGLGTPIARIGVQTTSGETSIEIGTAVDNTGKEVFARYTTPSGHAAVLAVATNGLNRLTASPLAYVHQTAGVWTRADIKQIEILGGDGAVRLAFTPQLDTWASGRGVVSPSEGKAIERLVRVLGSERASRILTRNDSDPSVATSVGIVRMTIAGGETIECGIAIESTNPGMRLHVSRSIGDDRTLVWVLNSEDAAGTGAWIAASGARGVTE